MRYLRPLAALALSTMLLLGPAALAAEPTPKPAATAETGSTPQSREGGPLDRFTAVAAIVGIAAVGVAGVYVYGLIRKGL